MRNRDRQIFETLINNNHAFTCSRPLCWPVASSFTSHLVVGGRWLVGGGGSVWVVYSYVIFVSVAFVMICSIGLFWLGATRVVLVVVMAETVEPTRDDVTEGHVDVDGLPSSSSLRRRSFRWPSGAAINIVVVAARAARVANGCVALAAVGLAVRSNWGAGAAVVRCWLCAVGDVAVVSCWDWGTIAYTERGQTGAHFHTDNTYKIIVCGWFWGVVRCACFCRFFQ